MRLRTGGQPRRALLGATIAPDVALAMLVVVAGLGLWSANDAGYAEILWYPVGLIFLLLAAMLAWTTPQRSLDRGSTIALAALSAFTAWAFMSILWAGDRGLALTGANRSLVYVVLFVVVARRRWRGLAALVALVAWSVITTAFGVAELARADDVNPAGAFIAGRFSSPVQYANANAALFVLAAWPCVMAFTEARLRWPFRALALGVAVVAVELAVLSQSKGAAIAVAITVAVVIALVPRRGRHLLPIAIAAAVTFLFHVPLLDVYRQADRTGDTRSLVSAAVVAIVASFACAVATGVLVAGVGERLVARSPRATRLGSIAFVTAAAVASGIALVLVVAHFGGPRETAHRAWHAFRSPGETASSSHFTSTAGNHRYDFWRVAALQFRRDPLTGAGMDNFATDYVRERRSHEQPTYPHSLEARLLGGTGAVGFALFAVFLAAAAWQTISAARRRFGDPFAAVGSAALAMLAYWFAHGSVDWLWEFPGVTAPVVVAVACCSRRSERERRRVLPAFVRHGRRFVAVAAVVVSALLLAPAWIAARDIASATASWRTDLAGAYGRLQDAASLNRLSDEPYVVAGTIAERRRDWPEVERQFARALARNPQNWYSHLELGLALSMRGDWAGAIAQLEQAQALDPREELVASTLATLRARDHVDITALDREFLIRTPLGAAR
jgi:hypothetical protein